MVDLSVSKKIHIIGIGGAGMSSIAAVLSQQGHIVSGSDLSDDLFPQLKDLGVKTYLGHSADNVSSDIDMIAYSSAIDLNTETNPNSELEHGRKEKIKILTRAKILKGICGLKKTLAVAGAHGKTTITAMLAASLKSIDASFIFGGQLSDGSLGGYWNEKGEWLIVEADESDGTFLELDPDCAILTSMDQDHIEHYKTAENLEKAYFEFISNTDAILNIDDPKINELSQKLEKATTIKSKSNSSSDADFLFEESIDYKENKLQSRANILHSVAQNNKANNKAKNKIKEYKLKLKVAGEHNISNATMAFAASINLGVNPKKALLDLETFSGVKRRLELIGSTKGITFIDDYAHTPLEIFKTLRTIKDWATKNEKATKNKNKTRVVCAFQPHRYSRVETLFETYADAFNDCQVLTISEIYSAGESKREGISGKLIVDAVLDAHPRKNVAWIPEKENLIEYYKMNLRSGDIFITLNAGDLNQIGQQIYSSL